MATWHQMKNPTPLFHATKWVVVDDPPGEPTGCYLFSSSKEAEDMVKRLRKKGRDHCYAIAPRGPSKK